MMLSLRYFILKVPVHLILGQYCFFVCVFLVYICDHNILFKVLFMRLASLLSHFSHVRLCVTPQTAAHQGYPRPWDSPGRKTGVGCHFLLQCMKVKSESEVAQSCLTQRPHGLQPIRLLHPWDFPGKSTRVGCIAFSSIMTTSVSKTFLNPFVR